MELNEKPCHSCARMTKFVYDDKPWCVQCPLPRGWADANDPLPIHRLAKRATKRGRR